MPQRNACVESNSITKASVRVLLAVLRVGTFQKHMRQSATAVWRRGSAAGCVR